MAKSKATKMILIESQEKLDYLEYKDSYGTKFIIFIRPDLMTARGMVVLQEVLDKIEQLTEETA